MGQVHVQGGDDDVACEVLQVRHPVAQVPRFVVEHDDAIDSYWPMEHNMTVFGFGRLNLNKYMTLTPAHFTIGFAESSDFASVTKLIDSVFRPLSVTVGQYQLLEH